MKFTLVGATGAIFALHLPIASAKHGNAHLNALEQRHRHSRNLHPSVAETGHAVELRDVDVEKRGGQCQFPTDAGLVAVTPNDSNGGWAMSPDQCCEPGNYCPFACPPGQVMAQWDPDATSYEYPMSMVWKCYVRLGIQGTNNYRTEDFTAIIVARFRSRSQINLTVSTVPATLAAKTRRAAMSPFVRQCCQVTRRC